jgi:hypothetical protein
MTNAVLQKCKILLGCVVTEGDGKLEFSVQNFGTFISHREIF